MLTFVKPWILILSLVAACLPARGDYDLFSNQAKTENLTYIAMRCVLVNIATLATSVVLTAPPAIWVTKNTDSPFVVILTDGAAFLINGYVLYKVMHSLKRLQTANSSAFYKYEV